MLHCGYEVWFTCDDERLPEYQCKVRKTTISCYIPSVAGKVSTSLAINRMMRASAIYTLALITTVFCHTLQGPQGISPSIFRYVHGRARNGRRNMRPWRRRGNLGRVHICISVCRVPVRGCDHYWCVVFDACACFRDLVDSMSSSSFKMTRASSLLRAKGPQISGPSSSTFSV